MTRNLSAIGNVVESLFAKQLVSVFLRVASLARLIDQLIQQGLNLLTGSTKTSVLRRLNR